MAPRLGNSLQKSQNANSYTHASKDHGTQQPFTLNKIYMFALQAGFQPTPNSPVDSP